jgi:hypothetical protein
LRIDFGVADARHADDLSAPYGGNDGSRIGRDMTARHHDIIEESDNLMTSINFW